MMSYLCNFCNIDCGNDSILCDVCDHWCHFSCTKLTRSQLEHLSNSDDPYFCMQCIKSNLPFASLSVNNFKKIFSEVGDKHSLTKFPWLVCNKNCQNFLKH